MNKSLSLHFTKEQCEWFAHFYESIALWLTKNERFAQTNFFFSICFWQFFTTFPLALYKRVTVTLYKRAMWVNCSFSWANAFSLFCSQKTSNLLKKPMSEFPTLVFEPKSKKFGISPIVPRANNMQMQKIFKKSEIDPLYSLHFT